MKKAAKNDPRPEQVVRGGNEFPGFYLQVTSRSVRGNMMPTMEAKSVVRPLVSVITPCYQQGALLVGAIESVRRQTHDRWQMIIIDDGSTDDTAAVAAEAAAGDPARFVVLRQSNQGQARARARGLEAAEGEHLVLLDADDRLEPEMMAALLGRLERDPDAAAAVGDAWLVDEYETRRWLFTQTRTRPWPAVLDYNPHGALAGAMFRRATITALGGLTFPGASGCEDWDIWVRLARCGRRVVACEGPPVARYRQSAGSFSRRATAMLRSGVDLLETCRREDARLAGAPWPAASAIDDESYQRLRNLRVFHALGVALAAGGGAMPDGALAQTLEPILTELAGGTFDRAAAVEQLRWGVQFVAWADPEAKAWTPERARAAVKLICGALEHAGVRSDTRRLAHELESALVAPDRPAPLLRRILRRLRG